MPVKSCEWEEILLVEDAEIANGTSAVTTPVDVAAFTYKTVYAKSDGTVTLTVLAGVFTDSNGNPIMHELKTGDQTKDADQDLSWSCSDELICFPVRAHMKYLQVKISNSSGAARTVSIGLSGG